MRTTRRAAAIIAAIFFLAPVSTLSAQDRGGVATETQERQKRNLDSGILWDGLGLIGLLGLLGLRKGHDEDSYHPSDFE
jgi:hypothetical protein